jgi:oxalate decarboxylase/phosphoglucose isomerase-like protein (cupin superfamily)
METPRIIRREDQPVHPLHGEGRIRRIVYPATVGSVKIFLGIAEVAPGEAPHVFHRHGREVVGDVELSYPSDFEEFYYIESGEASMQWRTADGVLEEVPVVAGDAVYFPPDVMEHRILNTGRAMLRVLYGGTPPARVVPVEGR